MKVCVVQPYYSFDAKDTESCYQGMLKLMDECDESMDLIVLPEYADIPASQNSKTDFYASIEQRNADILQRAKALAVRCNAMVFVNCAHENKNTTHAINRQGEVVGRYFKAHPAPSEVKTEQQGGNEMEVGYSYKPAEPFVLEMEGIRFGFMTCYDFYFYENYAPLALQNIDIVIGCSHQRTDTHDALSIINKFLSYHVNAYLVRSSVSLGEDSPICGCSCIIAPNGDTLVDMKSKVGLGICELDPTKKYYKAAGFKGKEKSHYEYIEEGRRPWLYRNGGKGTAVFDEYMPYPRLCAHRGFNEVAPENSMPAFGAAVALGAEEIEFDLWTSKDGVLVSAHDCDLERISDGAGKITEQTYGELLKLDFGVKFGEKYKGLKIPTFEEILQKFASRVIMNIHVKIWDKELPDDHLDEIMSLIKKYDCEKHVYFMTGNDEMLKKVKKNYPQMRCCVGAGKAPWDIVDRAIALGAEKVQLFKPYFNQEMIDKAHEHGVLCNVFYADKPEEAQKYLDMGIDCILTNDYLAMKNAVGYRLAKK